jgi:hypothetical protein
LNVVEAADSFITLIEDIGGQAEVTSAQGSIMAAFNAPGGVLYPLRLSPERKGSIQLCLGYLISRRAFSEAKDRQRLYDGLVAIVGPLSNVNLTGFPGFDARKLNDPTIKSALALYFQKLLLAAGVGTTGAFGDAVSG